MRAVTIIGARPQFIKAAMLSPLLGDYEILVHTGQHYDFNMSDVFFDEFNLPEPRYNLGIGSASHGRQTGLMLEAIEAVLINEKPDVVIVYGDTNSTLAGALAAVKLHIPVAHVEAGVRSNNLKMPEEINRRLTDHVSQYLFAPTETAVNNLFNEGISPEKIYLTGDIMFDAAVKYAVDVPQTGQILATIHRPENTDNPGRLSKIFDALNELEAVCPLHPRTRKMLNKKYDRIKFIEPVSYKNMLLLIKASKVVITDSGGLQKESYFLSRPCITVRPDTEWPELIEAGWNRLVEPADIIPAVGKIKTGGYVDFGDGHVAERIVEILKGVHDGGTVF